MPEIAVRRALEESVEEVLEKMFFIRPLGEAAARPAPENEFAAQLTFAGDPPGWLSLRVTSRAARSIAADFLADEEEALTEQQVGEVICELANMICGSVLSRVESGITFRLAAPRIVPSSDPPAPGATVHAVDIGNGALTVTMCMGNPACQMVPESAF